jgi:hypothetical protein
MEFSATAHIIRRALCRFSFCRFRGERLPRQRDAREILVSAPVRSAYLAALLFAGAQFLMMLTAVALHRRPRGACVLCKHKAHGSHRAAVR